MDVLTPLDDSVRDQGLRAMFSVLIERDSRTKDLVESVAASRGITDAVRSLSEALEISPRSWVQWLREPEHANAAASMTLALSDDAFASLLGDSANAPLAEFLDTSRQELATNRSVAVEYSKQIITLDSEVTIDLRESDSVRH